MAELNFNLHPMQEEIFNDPHRFKVVAAGRRFGKTYLSAVLLIINAMKSTHRGHPLIDKRVFYVAPTFDQGKRIIWDLLKALAAPLIKSTLENQGIMTLINGRKIEIKGSDNPDSLRGVGLSYVVLDEYAFMRAEVWEKILSPTLGDVEGDALFIGTPDGKNHFYDLFLQEEDDPDDEWKSFSYFSKDNPFLPPKEIERAKRRLTTENYKQEYEASFKAASGKLFKSEFFQYAEKEPEDGDWYVAVDPAGFSDLETTTAGKLNKLDECAIACVKVGPYGWYVGDIYHGRWDIRETSIRILRAAQKYKALCVGIEKGSLKNAILPYLQDQMLRIGTFPPLRDLTHGNQKKTERISWALGGRFEHKRIYFRKGAEFIEPLEDQLIDFPNPLSRDDLVDALAYIDQISQADYDEDIDDGREEDELDDEDFYLGKSAITGY